MTTSERIDFRESVEVIFVYMVKDKFDVCKVSVGNDNVSGESKDDKRDIRTTSFEREIVKSYLDFF